MNVAENNVPTVHHPKISRSIYERLFEAIRLGFIRAAHDCSDGGLAVAVTEMCFAGEFGARVDLAAVENRSCSTDTELLFSESQGRIVLEVPKQHEKNIQALFNDLPFSRIGSVVRGDAISFKGRAGSEVVSISRIDAKAAWKSTLNF